MPFARRGGEADDIGSAPRRLVAQAPPPTFRISRSSCSLVSARLASRRDDLERSSASRRRASASAWRRRARGRRGGLVCATRVLRLRGSRRAGSRRAGSRGRRAGRTRASSGLRLRRGDPLLALHGAQHLGLGHRQAPGGGPLQRMRVGGVPGAVVAAEGEQRGAPPHGHHARALRRERGARAHLRRGGPLELAGGGLHAQRYGDAAPAARAAAAGDEPRLAHHRARRAGARHGGTPAGSSSRQVMDMVSSAKARRKPRRRCPRRRRRTRTRPSPRATRRQSCRDVPRARRWRGARRARRDPARRPGR